MDDLALLFKRLPGRGSIEIIPRLSICVESHNYDIRDRDGFIVYCGTDQVSRYINLIIVNGLTTVSDACIFDGSYLIDMMLKKSTERFADVLAANRVKFTRLQLDPVKTGIVGEI